MTRTIKLTGRTAHEPEDIPLLRPACARCGGVKHEGYVRIDKGDGTEPTQWVCDSCLSPEQRAAWCKIPNLRDQK